MPVKPLVSLFAFFVGCSLSLEHISLGLTEQAVALPIRPDNHATHPPRRTRILALDP